MVVGAGNSAGQAVLNLPNATARVTMLVRGDRPEKTMSAYLIDRIKAHPLIDVHLETQLTELHAVGEKLTAVTFADAAGKSDKRAVDAVFLCIGGRPHTDWCSPEHVLTDSAGYILTGQDLLSTGIPPECRTLERDPFPLETSPVGLFAVGDVRHGSTKRVAAAVVRAASVEISSTFRRRQLERDAGRAGLRVESWSTDPAGDYAVALVRRSEPE